MELILTNLNGFGKYQKSILFLIGLVSMLCAFFNFAPVFTTAQPKLTCKYQANGTELPNNNCEAWRALQNNPELNSSYSCEFNSQFYGRTIVSEWGLYCDRLYLASSVTTLYMIGQIFSFIGGWIGDKFGRRVICILSLAGVCLSATISEVVISKFSLDWYTQYVVYSIGQFFLGFWSNSLFYSGLILLCELTSVKFHTLVSTLNLYLYVLGEFLLAFVYYHTRDFHNVNIFVAIFSAVLLVPMLLILPESPRFLIASKSYEKCYQVLKKISTVNGTTDQLFTQERFFKQIEANLNGTVGEKKNEINFHEIQSLLSIRSRHTKSQNKLNDSKLEVAENVRSANEIEIIQNKSVFHFFCNPITNFFMTVSMGVVWICFSLVYYGFSYGITLISEEFDPYVMFTLSCLAEASGYGLSFLDTKFSRKKVMLMFLASAAFFSAFVILLPRDVDGAHITWRSYLLMADATLGKMFVSAAFNSGYAYTYKMFPASVRNTMFTLCLSIGKLGSLSAPTIIMLQSVITKSFPYIVFTGMNFLAAAILIVLPDPSKVN